MIQHIWFAIMTLTTLRGEAYLLQLGFYAKRCPHAEIIISKMLKLAAKRDPTLPAALLRLHYHDCFVGGCDGSVLLDPARGYPRPEKLATPSIGLRGFEIIDMVKRVLELICPLKVSCADILALSARDAVVLTGGPRWEVPTGRRDGRSSSAVLATITLPQPHFTLSQLKHNFYWHGLTEDEMITLSGAHTIGFTSCALVWDRLYNYNTTLKTDPSMNCDYAAKLKKICPKGKRINKQLVPLDGKTPYKFDNLYYKNLEIGSGLLGSDQVIHDKRSSELGSNSTIWEKKFSEAMVRLGSLKVITGFKGEVRRNCRRRN